MTWIWQGRTWSVRAKVCVFNCGDLHWMRRGGRNTCLTRKRKICGVSQKFQQSESLWLTYRADFSEKALRPAVAGSVKCLYWLGHKISVGCLGDVSFLTYAVKHMSSDTLGQMLTWVPYFWSIWFFCRAARTLRGICNRKTVLDLIWVHGRKCTGQVVNRWVNTPKQIRSLQIRKSYPLSNNCFSVFENICLCPTVSFDDSVTSIAESHTFVLVWHNSNKNIWSWETDKGLFEVVIQNARKECSLFIASTAANSCEMQAASSSFQRFLSCGEVHISHLFFTQLHLS